MRAMGVVLGIDTSTTATKAVLVDEAGRVVGVGSASTASSSRTVLERAGPAALVGRDDRRDPVGPGAHRDAGLDVVAIGLTGQMHGLVLLDAATRCFGRRSCGTTSARPHECDGIRAAVGKERLVEITGNDALTGFTAPKLVWVRDHEPEVWSRAAPCAPAQGLRAAPAHRGARDGQGGRGRDAVVRALGARLVARDGVGARDRPCVAPADVRGSGGDRRDSRQRPTRPGSGSAPRSWPAAATRARMASAWARWTRASSPCLGTSGVIFAATDRPLVRARGSRPRVLPRGARTLASDVGDAVGRRLAALVSRRDRARRGVRPAGEGRRRLAPGSEGLVFLPYLSGERSPHPDPVPVAPLSGSPLTHGRRAPHPGRARGRRARPPGRPRPDGRTAGIVAVDGSVSGRRDGQPGLAPILADVLDAEIATVRRRRARRTAPRSWRPWARAGTRRWRRRPPASGPPRSRVPAPTPRAIATSTPRIASLSALQPWFRRA